MLIKISLLPPIVWLLIKISLLPPVVWLLIKISLLPPQRGLGAPAREAPISGEEQKQLMAHYYKKQEEMKVGTGVVFQCLQGL